MDFGTSEFFRSNRPIECPTRSALRKKAGQSSQKMLPDETSSGKMWKAVLQTTPPNFGMLKNLSGIAWNCYKLAKKLLHVTSLTPF